MQRAGGNSTIVIYLMNLQKLYLLFYSNLESFKFRVFLISLLLSILSINTVNIRIHLLCDDLINVHACQINYKEQQRSKITKLYANSKPVRYNDTYILLTSANLCKYDKISPHLF